MDKYGNPADATLTDLNIVSNSQELEAQIKAVVGRVGRI